MSLPTQVELKEFYNDIFSKEFGDRVLCAIGDRMREVAKNICCCFEKAEKPLKAARKASSLPVYEDAMSRLFDQYELQANPCFSADT